MPLETLPDLSLEEGLRQLEEFFEDEMLDCEYVRGHLLTDTTCTHVVTHRASDCIIGVNVCDVAAASIVGRMDTSHKCVKCGRPSAQCWTVRPI